MFNENEITRLIDLYGKQTTLAEWMKYAYELRTALQYWRKEKQLDAMDLNPNGTEDKK